MAVEHTSPAGPLGPPPEPERLRKDLRIQIPAWGPIGTPPDKPSEQASGSAGRAAAEDRAYEFYQTKGIFGTARYLLDARAVGREQEHIAETRYSGGVGLRQERHHWPGGDPPWVKSEWGTWHGAIPTCAEH